MHNEGQIKKSIRPLLDKYGKLNTTEVKKKLDTVLKFDSDDLEPANSRNEIKIMQRIGNMVCHQKEKIKLYEEGFIIDKSTSPAKFIAIEGLGNKKHPISNDEIERRKNRQFNGKKINWGAKRERDEHVGSLGEKFVFEYEKGCVASFDRSSIDRVIHMSKMQGDGLGYDISSVNEDGSIKKIEVKTTTAEKDSIFYMSRNEKEFFESNIDENLYIYRVYNFDMDAESGDLEIITAKDLIDKYNFDPISFAVRKK